MTFTSKLLLSTTTAFYLFSSPSIAMNGDVQTSHVRHALPQSGPAAMGIGLPFDEISSVRVAPMPRQSTTQTQTPAEQEEMASLERELLHGPYPYVLEAQSSDGSGSIHYYMKDGYFGASSTRSSPPAPPFSVYSNAYEYPILYVLRRLNPGEVVNEGVQQEIDGRTNIIAWLPMEDPGAFIRRHLVEPNSLLAQAMRRLVDQGHRRSTNYLDDLAPSTAPDQSTPLPANSSSALISEIAATESTSLPVPPLAVVGSLFPIGSY